MKKIYIVLTYTGTVLANIIQFYTKNEFAHVSISLDKELDEMYSFGRLNPYNPFIGGFVHEHSNDGTFKRFKKTKAKIYSLEITNKQYNSIKRKIASIQEEAEDYKFNVIGLFAVAVHKKIQPNHSFYCAEFVKYLLESAGIDTELPTIIVPEDFKKINRLEEVYAGVLRNYDATKIVKEPKISLREYLEVQPLQYTGNREKEDMSMHKKCHLMK